MEAKRDGSINGLEFLASRCVCKYHTEKPKAETRIKCDVILPSMQCCSMESIHVPEKNTERNWKEWVEPESSRPKVLSAP